MDDLYRINDVLTALANELRIQFGSEQAEDEALQDATLAVAQAFGISEPSRSTKEET